MKRTLMCILALSLWAGCVWANISQDDAERAFVRADIAYKAERYDEAIGHYEEILNGGQESGALYFNLGNCYFKKNDLGRAILNYERAYRLIPRDVDLRANRNYALGQVKRPIPGRLTFWEDIVRDSRGQISMDELAWFILLFAFLSGIAHLCGMFFPLWRDRTRPVLVLCGIIVLLLTGLLAGQLNLARGQAVIIKESPARYEPRPDATVHFSLDIGQTVKILKKEELWFKVERPDGKMGWIEQEDLEGI